MLSFTFLNSSRTMIVLTLAPWLASKISLFAFGERGGRGEGRGGGESKMNEDDTVREKEGEKDIEEDKKRRKRDKV
jgi:hypothetical protein